MYKVLSIFLLLSSLALGQAVAPSKTEPSAPTQAPAPEHHDDDTEPPPSSAARVSPMAPVITIHGLCDNGAKVGKSTDGVRSDHATSGPTATGTPTLSSATQNSEL